MSGRFTNLPARLRESAELIAAGGALELGEILVITSQMEDAALRIETLERDARGPIDWRDGPPPDELKDGRPVLLDVGGRVVLGRCYRKNYTRADTSNWWNFDSHGCDESRVTRHCPVTP